MHTPQTPNKLFSETKILFKESYIRINNIHIIINYDNFNSTISTDSIKKGHHVHIFIHHLMDSFYGNDNLFDFVEECAILSGNKVIIHIPKFMKKLKYSIEAKLDGSRNYQILTESECVLFKYDTKSTTDYYNGIKRFLLIVFDSTNNTYSGFPVSLPMLYNDRLNNELANTIADRYNDLMKHGLKFNDFK